MRNEISPLARLLPLVLFVDQDEDSRAMYGQYMKAANWSVEEAADGREALAKALALRPDLIVTELRLPGIDGFELCKLWRRDFATRAIPILVVTGDAYKRDLELARSAGATGVLLKPCVPEELLAEAVRLLEASRNPVGAAAAAPVDAEPHAAPPRSQSRSHVRGETAAPPASPPGLICPLCDEPLDYKTSQVGGVSARNAEQWDYFVCERGCGTFQYRQRTRKLRRV
jgi:two-component system, chemotaxis family, chemotaxis protein CheY